MEPEGSSPCSKESSTGPILCHMIPIHSHPILLMFYLIQSAHFRLGLPSTVFSTSVGACILRNDYFSFQLSSSCTFWKESIKSAPYWGQTVQSESCFSETAGTVKRDEKDPVGAVDQRRLFLNKRVVPGTFP
jgi:hypothetical protein